MNEDQQINLDCGLVGVNMYTYCLNNPLNYRDSQGLRPIASINPDKELPSERKVSMDYMKWQGNGVDITEKLNVAMKNNSENLAQYAENHNYRETTTYFVEKVSPGGEWDFKSQGSWNLDPKLDYYYKGMKLRFDDPRDQEMISYGYWLGGK